MRWATIARCRAGFGLAVMAACGLLGLAGCSPQSEGRAADPVSAAPAADVAASAASTASATAQAATGAASAPASATLAASATGIALRRSNVQIKFVQMFERECLPRIAPEAKLSPAQRVDFCQCYAAALADHNSEQQLARYLAGQDAAQLQSDANRYGQPCLEQAKRKP